MWACSFLTSLTRTDRLLQILNRLLLAAETVALLVMQPAKLLEDFSMIGITLENTPIGKFGVVILQYVRVARTRLRIVSPYVFLLFVHMTNLEPDVFLSQRRWWKRYNISEALQTSKQSVMLMN